MGYFWGLTDKFNWMDYVDQSQAYPTLLDSSYQRKPGYYAVREALLAGIPCAARGRGNRFRCWAGPRVAPPTGHTARRAALQLGDHLRAQPDDEAISMNSSMTTTVASEP